MYLSLAKERYPGEEPPHRDAGAGMIIGKNYG
jgi:hypothetical protein